MTPDPDFAQDQLAALEARLTALLERWNTTFVDLSANLMPLCNDVATRFQADPSAENRKLLEVICRTIQIVAQTTRGGVLAELKLVLDEGEQTRHLAATRGIETGGAEAVMSIAESSLEKGIEACDNVLGAATQMLAALSGANAAKG